MKREENEFNASSGSWLLSFVLGGLIGAAFALLVAPRSGRQTREQIKDLAEDVKEKAGTYYDKAKDQVSTVMQKGADLLEQKKTELGVACQRGERSVPGPLRAQRPSVSLRRKAQGTALFDQADQAQDQPLEKVISGFSTPR